MRKFCIRGGLRFQNSEEDNLTSPLTLISRVKERNIIRERGGESRKSDYI
jgi:hypothetical protein